MQDGNPLFFAAKVLGQLPKDIVRCTPQSDKMGGDLVTDCVYRIVSESLQRSQDLIIQGCLIARQIHQSLGCVNPRQRAAPTSSALVPVLVVVTVRIRLRVCARFQEAPSDVRREVAVRFQCSHPTHYLAASIYVKLCVSPEALIYLSGGCSGNKMFELHEAREH